LDLYPQLKLLIHGKWQSRPGVPVINPADAQVIGRLPQATETDLAEAVAAAEKGLQVWRSTPPLSRAGIIHEAARLLRERMEEAAVTITMEQGKPIAESRLEVLRAAEILDWNASEGRRLYGRVVPSGPGLSRTVLRQPVGIVFALTPWNFPISSPARKMGGALSAGCSIILKASGQTPGGAFHLGRALVDAGLPPGVLNLVFGNSAAISEFLIPHPAVRLITLTGSTAVGKQLAALAGRHIKPAVMELGGHAPVIVCDDVDPVAVADLATAAKSRNAGQTCISPTRFFVQEKLYDRFVRSFGEKAGCLRLGDGLDPQTQMGPLINENRLQAIEALIADGTARGARLISGGRRVDRPGFFYPLTVLADVPEESRAMQEEPFGPLALISPVHDLEEAIRKANAVPYGLAGYAFTHSVRKANQLKEELEVGNLSINQFASSHPALPFGGVKESGYGREGGIEGLETYTVLKSVIHRIED
jgi:succinate-semialdehyde dehydrogenase / glutarate-semialdehyde dehydrogenase